MLCGSNQCKFPGRDDESGWRRYARDCLVNIRDRGAAQLVIHEVRAEGEPLLPLSRYAALKRALETALVAGRDSRATASVYELERYSRRFDQRSRPGRQSADRAGYSSRRPAPIVTVLLSARAHQQPEGASRLSRCRDQKRMPGLLPSCATIGRQFNRPALTRSTLPSSRGQSPPSAAFLHRIRLQGNIKVVHIPAAGALSSRFGLPAGDRAAKGAHQP